MILYDHYTLFDAISVIISSSFNNLIYAKMVSFNIEFNRTIYFNSYVHLGLLMPSLAILLCVLSHFYISKWNNTLIDRDSYFLSYSTPFKTTPTKILSPMNMELFRICET